MLRTLPPAKSGSTTTRYSHISLSYSGAAHSQGEEQELAHPATLCAAETMGIQRGKLQPRHRHLPLAPHFAGGRWIVTHKTRTFRLQNELRESTAAGANSLFHENLAGE